VKVTSAAGAVTQTRQYNAWGESETGGSEPGFAFTGREWDPEVQLYYYRARYYDPKPGRLASQDPIGFAGGDLNLYRYVEDNPVNLTDPTGKFVGIPVVVWLTHVAAPYAAAGGAAAAAWAWAAWEWSRGVPPDPTPPDGGGTSNNSSATTADPDPGRPKPSPVPWTPRTPWPKEDHERCLEERARCIDERSDCWTDEWNLRRCIRKCMADAGCGA